MVERENKKTRFPPIGENVYSRFNDDGWGIRDVTMTKQGEEALERTQEEKEVDNGESDSEGI